MNVIDRLNALPDHIRGRVITEILRNLPSDEKETLLVLLKEKYNRMYYQSSPVEWAVDKLGIRRETLLWSLNEGYGSHDWDGTPDPIAAIMNGVAAWDNVAVESATATGKTFIAAVIVLWFLDNFKDALVVTVAPKEEQLRLNLWKEVGRLWKKFETLRPDAKLMDLKIRMKPNSDEKDAWIAVGFSVGVGASEDSATKAQGFHAEHMLIIYEETPGIDWAVVEAFDNTSKAPHNLQLAFGNPDRQDDTLHRLFVRDDWEGVIISAMDHPNVVCNDPEVDYREHTMIVPGAASWKGVLGARAKYDPLGTGAYKTHSLYLSRIRGICPTGSAESLFSNAALTTVAEGDEMRGVKRGLGVPIMVRRLDKIYSEGNTFSTITGETRIYELPPDDITQQYAGRYLITADVMGGGTTGDGHFAVVFDRVKKKIVAVIDCRGPRNDYAEELLWLADLYQVDWPDPEDPYLERKSKPVIAWETNGVGALIMHKEFAKYEALYHRRQIDKPGAKPRKVAGWYTGKMERQTMVQQLEQWGLTLVYHPERMPDEEVFNQAKGFVKDKNGKYVASTGNFDDAMMALGIALVMDMILVPPMKLDTPAETRVRKMREENEYRRGKFAQKSKDPLDVSLPGSL